jgi:ferric-dicitrate binding protein FerR (iron transport regulator)
MTSAEEDKGEEEIAEAEEVKEKAPEPPQTRVGKVCQAPHCSAGLAASLPRMPELQACRTHAARRISTRRAGAGAVVTPLACAAVMWADAANGGIS